MKNKKYLLITTKDHRKFVTKEENLPLLKEFAKVFHATVSVANIPGRVEVLNVKKLAMAICDQNYKGYSGEYSVVKRVLPERVGKRDRMLENASNIRSYIRSKLLDKKTISLKDLKEMYKTYNITDSCLCNHLSAVRKELAREGYLVLKVGAGKYCLKT